MAAVPTWICLFAPRILSLISHMIIWSIGLVHSKWRQMLVDFYSISIGNYTLDHVAMSSYIPMYLLRHFHIFTGKKTRHPFVPLNSPKKITSWDLGVFKNRGYPKMDGENNGKPYFLMDDLGGKPTIFGNIHLDFFLQQKSTSWIEELRNFAMAWLLWPCFLGWKNLHMAGGLDDWVGGHFI